MEDRFETVSPQELAELRAENDQIELLRYNAEVNVFRADVALRLQQLALGTNSSWAHYKTYRTCEPDYGFTPSEIDVFMMMDLYLVNKVVLPNVINKVVVPSIRLFRVERFNQPGGVEHLVTEVIVDREGDSLMTFDSKYVEGPRDAVLEPKTETEDENGGYIIKKIDLVQPVVMPFMVDGTLSFDGAPGNVPVIRKVIDTSPGGGVEAITPFGNWLNIHDKVHALSRAVGIFSEVKSLEPDHSWVARSE